MPDVAGVLGERHNQLWGALEFHQEKLVGGVGGLEELVRGQLVLTQHFSYAAADIKYESDGDGLIVHREADDGLFSLVIQDVEVFFFEPDDRPA